jgi:hypothetical protein
MWMVSVVTAFKADNTCLETETFLFEINAFVYIYEINECLENPYCNLVLQSFVYINVTHALILFKSLSLLQCV